MADVSVIDVLRRRASQDITAWHVLNDNNLFGEKRTEPFLSGGLPFTNGEKAADEKTVLADLRARAKAGDPQAAGILAEIGDDGGDT
ncbi:MAG: hypothetical protein KGI98_15550 [Euryarchaeota archaeon]|nr:hypothetical protein [Euryarchaeota archaeon]